MTLNGNIQNLLGGLKTQIPPETFGELQGMFDRLAAERTGAAAPTAGHRVPEATLTASDGTSRTLRELYGEGTLVLLFYRGRWCPFCDLTLRAYDAAAGKFRALGARLVAVSPQTEEETAKTAEERSLSYAVLRDPGNAAAESFGLAWELTPKEQGLYAAFHSHVDRANGEDRWRLPAPAVFVIDQSGVVRWSWVDSNWTRRAEPAEVLDAVRAVREPLAAGEQQ